MCVCVYIYEHCKTEKRICQGCILSPCLFNLYAEYIMWHAGLDDSQAGIKTVGRSINSLTYAENTTLLAESEEGLKNLLMRWKSRLKKLAWNSPIIKQSHGIQSHHFMANRRGKIGSSDRFSSLAPQSLQTVTAAMKLKDVCSLEGKLSVYKIV